MTSPRLFDIYVNQLVTELISMQVGCRIDDVTVNNINDADDMEYHVVLQLEVLGSF